jgi:hypothetical protein
MSDAGSGLHQVRCIEESGQRDRRALQFLVTHGVLPGARFEMIRSGTTVRLVPVAPLAPPGAARPLTLPAPVADTIRVTPTGS